MGGPGSTRWVTHSKALTVEDCRVLSIDKMAREGLIVPYHASGTLRWTDTATGETVATIGFTVVPEREIILPNAPFHKGPPPPGDGIYLTLQYTLRREDDEQHVTEKILLENTRPHFGGRRWWFTCPLRVGGRYCGRRVGKLYLPPGGKYFGCRHCYELTYTSCQESHAFDRMFASLGAATGMTPVAVKQVLLNPD